MKTKTWVTLSKERGRDRPGWGERVIGLELTSGKAIGKPSEGAKERCTLPSSTVWRGNESRGSYESRPCDRRLDQDYIVTANLQQRLAPRKMKDGRAWSGAWIRECHTLGWWVVLTRSDRTQLKPYMGPLVMTLLTRMRASKTDKYVYHVTYFLLLTMAIDVAGMGPGYAISTVEEIQPQCEFWFRRRGGYDGIALAVVADFGGVRDIAGSKDAAQGSQGGRGGVDEMLTRSCRRKC